VPARGIGKGVLDQLERLPAAPTAGADIPLLAGLAAPHATEAASPLWVRVGRAVDGGLLPARATASLGACGPFDKLLLDPPREGAVELVKALPQGWPRRIVYVSCDPATLARDAGVLVHVQGFRLGAAGVVNMFPHTAHVESIALFER